MSVSIERFPEGNEIIQEALASLDRAIGGINTLHIGPLDYNIATTVDDLLVAVRLLEQFRLNTQFAGGSTAGRA